ncbi:hypothetical protein BDV93DRAFT_223346 [Ceratobasidium sp. AG-I]|nr:hypothetical protein BDV93DRAFT_223346 [Ceratobasidium sp. AG-I]
MPAFAKSYGHKRRALHTRGVRRLSFLRPCQQPASARIRFEAPSFKTQKHRVNATLAADTQTISTTSPG